MGRLGIIGAECTGKSALASALADEWNAVVATEAVRDFVQTHHRPPRADEQQAIMVEQQRREDDLAARHPDRIVVADPAPLMTALYSVEYFDDPSLLDRAIEWARGYTLVAWCDRDLPWQPDPGVRDGPEYRDRVHGLIADCVVERLIPAGIPVLLLSGTRQVRVAALRRAWQTAAPHQPT